MTLTKRDIAQAILEETNLGKVQSIQLADALFEIIKQTLESGEDVLISGFGKWSLNEKQERRGRNPQTGESLMLAPRKVVTFKCARVLKNRVNRRSEK
jgi:integration host factor subunit alpha